MLRSPDGKVWKSNPPNRNQRPARNMVCRQTGAAPYAKAIVYDEISALKTVFDTSLAETIAMETNCNRDNFQTTFIAE